MARILVTGASGLLGSNLVLEAAGRHETVAVTHTHPVRLEGIVVLQTDLSTARGAEAAVRKARPEWVIHCAAATNLDACEADPALAFRLNRDMAGAVAAAARGMGARLMHISTDAVFDGEIGGYNEEAAPRPINVYGRSKLAGEEAVREAHPQAAIVRTNLYGWNAQAKVSLAEWFLSNLAAGRRCLGFTDVFFTPLLVNDLARVLLDMLEAELQGVFHVAGEECLSKHAFGQRVARVFGLEESLIDPGRVEQANLAAPRPKRLCLNSGRIEQALGIRLPSADAGLLRFRQLREQGFVQRLKAFSLTHIPDSTAHGL